MTAKLNRFFPNLTKEVTGVSKTTGSKKRTSILASFYTDIEQDFEKGLMASTIEASIRQKGYQGSASLVRHYVSNMKKARRQTNDRLTSYYTIQRRYVIHLLYQSESVSKDLSPEEYRCLFEQYPFVIELYNSIQRFKTIFETHDVEGLKEWILQADQSSYKELHSFAEGTKKDLNAVIMAVQSPYSNGLVEGTINKVKVIKRIMYSCCSFSLLRNKILLLVRFHLFN